MIEIPTTTEHADEGTPFLESLLREALPEIKLSLGELIDRENSRALPERYARLLPDTMLVVTLRPEAAHALAPFVEAVETDLTDSVKRHGLLYDRAYRVQLRRSEDTEAPLYRVSAHAGHAAAGDSSESPEANEARRPAAREYSGDAAAQSAPAHAAREAVTEALPVADPEATRIDDAGPAGWQPGEWILVVEDLEGEEREVFRLTDPFTTVGRRTDDPELQTTVALSDVPHVSRRQLVLLFEARDGKPGFQVYNLGLNTLHLPDQDLPGARIPRGTLRLESIAGTSVAWVPPGIAMRLGDHGPVLRIDDVPLDMDGEDAEHDPDATVHE